MANVNVAAVIEKNSLPTEEAGMAEVLEVCLKYWAMPNMRSSSTMSEASELAQF